VVDEEVNRFACEAAFATLTNVNFDPQRFVDLVKRTVELRESLKEKVEAAGGRTEFPHEAAGFEPSDTLGGMIAQGEKVGVKPEPGVDPDIHSLKMTLTYGIKGVSAYADHASILGQEDDGVFSFVHRGLAATLDEELGVEELMGLVLECGEVNLRTMELLDAANTGAYGNPAPTRVPLGHRKGKAILVSGHDLKDLEEVLKRSVGRGIYVLHPRGDAPHPRLSRAEEAPPPLRPLRDCLAEPAEGVPRVSRSDPDDNQLPPEAVELLRGQHIHDWAGGLAGGEAHR